MPSDLPVAPPAVLIPYYRVLAFAAGGGITFAVVVLLSNLLH